MAATCRGPASRRFVAEIESANGARRWAIVGLLGALIVRMRHAAATTASPVPARPRSKCRFASPSVRRGEQSSGESRACARSSQQGRELSRSAFATARPDQGVAGIDEAGRAREREMRRSRRKPTPLRISPKWKWRWRRSRHRAPDRQRRCRAGARDFASTSAPSPKAITVAAMDLAAQAEHSSRRRRALPPAPRPVPMGTPKCRSNVPYGCG